MRFESNAKIPTASGDPRPGIVVGITTAQSCLNLQGHLRSLRQAGFRVTLVSGPGPMLEQTARREGVDWVAVPMRRAIAPFADLVSLIRLVRLLLRLRPAVVEFSTPKAGLLGSLAAWMVQTPVRIYLLRGLKLERSKGWRRWVLLRAERLASACSHRVLCNSASLLDEARELRLAAPRKLCLLGAGSSVGVDPGRFSPGETPLRNQLGIPAEALVIGFVGRLTCDKGVPELVEAFDLIHALEPRARLLLVGWLDPAEDALPTEVAERIESDPLIFLTGYVADPAPCYRAMDMLVLPSWREGFPAVVLEAAATELPVVTTLTTGSRDAVVPEVTGFLIPPGYPEAIAEMVMKLLRSDALRSRMGQAGRARVIQHFEKENVLNRTNQLYLELLRQSGRSPGPSWRADRASAD